MSFLLHHLLIESAARLPKKEALRFKDHSITYEELDRLTNQLARKLCNLGVKRGDRVGIYLHKSMASVISIFGILKAGGIYVPLDPKAPTTRLAYIMRNCDISVLLTSSEQSQQIETFLLEDTPTKVVIFTDNEENIPAGANIDCQFVSWLEVLDCDDSPFPAVGVIETDLAYILYTSGSTGVPKGVMITHRTIFTFINWCIDTLEVNEADRVTSHAPIHFDLSTFDIFVTIKAGGTVILVPDTLSVFPIQLVRLIQNERVTITYMVPSIYSMMVNYGKLTAHDLSSLRMVLFAGEVFPIKFLRRLVEAIPHPEFYNLYGPTETNVCTYYKVQPEDLEPEQTQPVPIGKACENMEVFAVQDDGNPVTQPGEEGELWVRGSCVAQGYWADPEKTAQGFVPNHYQEHYQEVAYRTGDIVTLAEDRVNWIYRGRRDHMIKSRGYRIELGEIESVLYVNRGVKEAVVVTIPDDLIGNRIKAFVVPMHENGLTAKDLQVECSQRLPHYMVPEIIEFVKELPKTSTGKINRTLLSQS